MIKLCLNFPSKLELQYLKLRSYLYILYQKTKNNKNQIKIIYKSVFFCFL